MGVSVGYVLASLAAACSAPSSGPAPKPASVEARVEASHGQASSEGVANLPFSQGRAFRSLDDYLAFLRERGRYDVPWYREIRPGVFELVSRRGPGGQVRTFEREELERKFGFDR